MPDATLADYSALANAVVMGTYPILPKPEWGQDAAMIAFAIDELNTELMRVRASMSQSEAERYEVLTEAMKEIERLQAIIKHMLAYGVEWAATNLGEPYRSMIMVLGQEDADGSTQEKSG